MYDTKQCASETIPDTQSTDWLVACFTNGRTDRSAYVIDQRDMYDYHSDSTDTGYDDVDATVTRLTLGVNYGEVSGDFNIHSVYVWDKELNNREMKVVTRALRKELGGVPDLSPVGTPIVGAISDLRAYYMRFLLASRPA